MLARHFLTHQPAEHRNLASCLLALMPGRVLIVVAVPDAVAFLGQDAMEQLEVMGSSMVRNLASFEAWAMVAQTPSATPIPATAHHPRPLAHTPSAAHMVSKHRTPSGHRRPQPHHQDVQQARRGWVWAEAAAIIRTPQGVESGPLHMHAQLPRTPGVRCSWHEDPAMKEQRDFCNTYEGYLQLCTCASPLTPALRHSAPEIKMREVIPVAMLTAVKPFNFYRQLVNLLETPGAAQTPILVMVDGPNTEILRLARIFGLEVLVHRPQGAPGSTTLLNMHFRFSVHNVFNYFPEVDKAIILEDDLLLSPDFLSFFQQTSWLLDVDPTIFCVNAFSINSYPGVAHDPTVLRRFEMMPQFGWMVTRRWAREQHHAWIPEKETADWDWWLFSQTSLRGRHALVPEIGRTFHAGAAGAHVSGWEQEHLFSHMIYNQDPDVKLQGLEDLTLERYEAKFKREILTAEDLEVIPHPCTRPFLPQHKAGPFRVFVVSETQSDEYGAYYVMQLCLHGFSEESREKFNAVVRFNIEGRILYIIGCPASPYCTLFPKGISMMKPPSPELVQSAEDQVREWQRRNYPPYFLQRSDIQYPYQEFLMENLLHIYWNGSLVKM
ncbi:protein O-linked-mannose beta-1,2-N-acetylglucosaminyltransferase 1 [Procambarus clarkii]|uniref:protein O-linked-mannose beta-1,2-N-acetylglucosaminyltransferase 1 n=1 Tax=Procambarus clarkii TaxID=6728 RepID=UPI003742513A